MLGDKFKVVFKHSVQLIDSSIPKTDSRRYITKEAGEYVFVLIENPSHSKGSNWLMIEGTKIGATHDYIRSQGTILKY